jgi:ferredoxin
MYQAGQVAWDPQRVIVPVLVLNAPNPVWTPDYQAYVRSLSPRTDYRTMNGVGHFLMLEKPVEFNRELVDDQAAHKLNQLVVHRLKDQTQQIYTMFLGGFFDGVPRFASCCQDCGECEEKCPQQLPIRERLKLVAEDEEQVRDFVVQVLKSHGYNVLAAESGARA